MRVLALVLVLANVGLFAWARWVAPPPAYEPPRAIGPEVARLELVGEVPGAAPRDGRASGAGRAIRESGAADRGSGTPPRDGGDAVGGAQRSPLSGGQLLVDAAASRCLRVGPFVELPDAAEVAAVLRARGLPTRQRLLESDVWVGYAVMLNPAPTREDALRRAAALREAGLQDIYVEPGGELRNAISLGLFSDPARAQRRRREIADLGFDAVIRDRTRTAQAYWVDFEVPSGERLDLSRFEAPGRSLAAGECSR